MKGLNMILNLLYMINEIHTQCAVTPKNRRFELLQASAVVQTQLVDDKAILMSLTVLS